MNENLQELRHILSLLYERKQTYMDLVRQPIADPSDQIHFIPEEEILKNIEKLIELVSESIEEHINSSGKKDIGVSLQSLKKFISS